VLLRMRALLDTIAQFEPTTSAYQDDGNGIAVTATLTPLLYNIHQVCAILGGISERNLRGMVSAAEFPRPIKIGRLSRWRPPDVAAWVAKL
jgi:predicted DNA-binding transcriptional regulator AlpA